MKLIIFVLLKATVLEYILIPSHSKNETAFFSVLKEAEQTYRSILSNKKLIRKPEKSKS